MAFVGDTNVFHSNAQTGQPNHQKLDVMDAITDMAPFENPLMAMTGRGAKPMDRFCHYQLDYSGAWPTSMGATRQANEGSDANPTALQNRTFNKNNLHYFQDSFSVSDTHEAMDQWGLSSEIDYQNAKLAEQIVRDVEFAMHRSVLNEQSTGPNTATGSDGVVRKMGGLIDQIENIGNYLANGPALATGATPYNAHISTDLGAALGVLQASHITTALRNMWNRGGMQGRRCVGFANGAVKEIISELFAPNSGATSVYRRSFGSQEAREIVLPVDIVTTDFGTVELMLNRSVRDSAEGASATTTDDVGDLLLFDPAYTEMRVLLDFQTQELARIGSSRKFMQQVDLTFLLTAPNTAGLLTGIKS